LAASRGCGVRERGFSVIKFTIAENIFPFTADSAIL